MNGLKILVFAMGGLILVGIGLVGYGVTRKQHPAGVPPAQTANAPQGGFFNTEIPVPHGAKLDQVAATGDRLVLRFTGGETDKLLLIDVHSGQVTGSVTLVPEAH